MSDFSEKRHRVSEREEFGAYARTATHDGRAADIADVTGASLSPARGHPADGGGWRRGGYPMMP
jgi:hypothetical protein